MRVKGGLGLYGRYLGISIRSQMQYRASFLMLSLGHFLVTGIEFATIWILFERFGTLRGWTLPEVGLFYGIINTAFALSDAAARGFDLFGGMVKNGDFDRVLLRPRGAALQVAGQELTLRRVGRLTQGLIVLGWSASRLGLAWSAGKALLVVASIASASCLFFGIVVLQATAAFWTVETLEIFNCLTYGGVQTTAVPGRDLPDVVPEVLHVRGAPGRGLVLPRPRGAREDRSARHRSAVPVARAARGTGLPWPQPARVAGRGAALPIYRKLTFPTSALLAQCVTLD